MSIGEIFSISIKEIEDLEDKYGAEEEVDEEMENEAHDDDGVGPEIVCLDAASAEELRFNSLEDFYQQLGMFAVAWLREWSESHSDQDWTPCWFEAWETSSHSGEFWRVDRRPLPPAAELPHSSTFPGLRVGQGFKVYAIEYGLRGFASGAMGSGVRLTGQPLAGTIPNPIPINVFAEWKHVGGLLCLDRASFALRSDHPTSKEAQVFLGPSVEWLPAHDGEKEWFLANTINSVEALDHKSTRFSRIDENRRGIDGAEFDVDLLKRIEEPLFKVKDDCHRRLYFLERPGEESFPEFCSRVWLTGVRWTLVWCEDIQEIERTLGEFVGQVESRPYRGSTVANYKGGLSGLQTQIYKIAKFREIVQTRGVPAAIKEIEGLGGLGIPSVKEICGGDWYWSNQPENPGIQAKLAESLSRRDPLLEIRGFMCLHLPQALSELRKVNSAE